MIEENNINTNVTITDLKMYNDFFEESDITELSEIQEISYNPIVQGKDVIAISPTGTGKTLAYLLPLVEKIDMENKNPQVLILLPTHELASQVYKQLALLCKHSEKNVTSALLIGGAGTQRQIEKLKEKPRIIVGSAGKILDLYSMKKLKMHFVKTIVLDEGDRLVDKKNIDDTTKVIKTTLKDRQLVFISATAREDAIATVKIIMDDPITVHSSPDSKMPDTIKHVYIISDYRKKIEVLRKVIHSQNVEKALVFLNNPESIDTMAKRLEYHKIKAASLHGKADKTARKKALDDLVDGRITVLVASDVVARGLDVKGITHVIHLDVPEVPEYYLHRAGRTGRMNENGTSIVIATIGEEGYIRKYENRFNIKFDKMTMDHGEMIIDKGNKLNKKPFSDKVKDKTKDKTKVAKKPKS